MKTCYAILATAGVLALASIPSSDAFAKYTPKFPNGDDIGKPAGHEGPELSKFGEDFAAANHIWTLGDDGLCKKECPVSKMTYGEKFGDPCCTWKEGATPDFKAELKGGKYTKTVCAATTAPPSTDEYKDKDTPVVTPAPVDEYKSEETTAPVDEYKSEETPAPVVDEYKSEETPAPVDEYKTEETPMPVPTNGTATDRDDCEVDESDDDDDNKSYGNEDSVDDYRRH